MRILIVEDEVKIREGMGKIIRSLTGHMIVGEASDGEEALEMVLRFNPDLIITDIRMPKMDGLEMARRLREQNIPVHVVILTGYSEFEYAKKAIHYGVDDYLLKPLGVEDVQQMLVQIEEKINKETELKQGLGENRLRDLLVGNVENTPSSRREVWKVCGFTESMSCQLMVGYIGGARADYRRLVEEKTEELKHRYEDLKIYLLYQENCQVFTCVCAGSQEKRLEEFQVSFYHRMLLGFQSQEQRPVWAREVISLDEMAETYALLKDLLSYNLVTDVQGWMTRDLLQSLQIEIFEEPMEINSRLKNALCQEEPEKIRREIQALLEYMRKKVYKPWEVRRSLIKSYGLILDTLWDFDRPMYEHMKNANVLQQLENAVLWQEMEAAYADIAEILAGHKVKREDISNFVIKKAINYIREHYQEGITQEEVSRKLEITPEYLSTLFNREMGINFSAFLKQFRISHAKRLLKGTDMKIYQVAEAVGYSDAKYFARVFKKVQGISPVDYRKLN